MKVGVVVFFLVSLCSAAAFSLPTKMFGLWYCGNDGCDWSIEPNTTQADWILNRGDGKPTANVVIFSFVDPQALLLKTTNAYTINGVPRGMTLAVVDFFRSHGIYVMFSIGGEEYSADGKWAAALKNPETLAANAAAMAKKFKVGVEIDYERTADLDALNSFAKSYRNLIPFDNSSSATPESVLTVDLGAGTGYLTAVAKLASEWRENNIVNFVTAMVTGSPYGSASTAETYWEQHLNGVNWDKIPPTPPAALIGSLYVSDGSKNCKQYDGTVLSSIIPWAKTKQLRGIFFWAVGCTGSASSCITDCTGIQKGSMQFL
eukprot:TRINITY_DN5179_c0_g1_i1.p1 TRINITY_DN5179_c0_g1~~TRINITY_DN5179_c0_g1_i1.p1  ORF type:complete len:318 (+),score=51.31 TRINITY_DN5179_c0_g1_i1:674-1627(+)